jgi:DNA-binding winged helix-turn-helix (wHTH) protein
MGPGTGSVFTGFKLGPLMIDLDHGAVSGEQGSSGLTPRAEALLLLFSRRANTLVSREDILETIWVGRVVEDAAITHCVWQIRRALGPAGKDILQTRSKRGYVLVVPDAAWIRHTPAPVEPVAPETAREAEAAPEGLLPVEPSSIVDAVAPEPHGRTARKRNLRPHRKTAPCRKSSGRRTVADGDRRSPSHPYCWSSSRFRSGDGRGRRA